MTENQRVLSLCVQFRQCILREKRSDKFIKKILVMRLFFKEQMMCIISIATGHTQFKKKENPAQSYSEEISEQFQLK